METEVGRFGEGVERGKERGRPRTEREMRREEDSRTHLVSESRGPRSVFKMFQHQVGF